MTRTVFTGGRIFDGTGAAPADGDILIEGSRILEVGPGLVGDEQVDVSGKALLPGLFDCHTHVMFSHIDFMKAMEEPFSYKFFDAVRNLEATLRIGITTIRDASGADMGVRQAVEDGLIRGPRMQISLAMIGQTGGHADAWMPCGGPIPLFLPYPGMPDARVDGAEEMRKMVRELIRDGADVLKVATSGGVLSPRDDPQHPHFRPEELDVLVTEAAAAGRWVMAHSHGAEGTKQAVRAGIRSIEHGTYLDDEAVELMAQNGTYLVPTLLASIGVMEAVEAGVQVPEAVLAKEKALIGIPQASFRRALDAGVKIAMGTDTGVTPHGQNLRELELMVEYGMTPTQALVATTATAAELMGLEAELGTLESGKRADVVVMDGDPLDVSKMGERVVAVYKDGEPAFA
ncbi:MAG: amidohydrolase family protein [Actinomycetota bacterium]|nr:amidohydrolase family protein [Actinomycetota bacterium]